jgi:hypothetical protein
VCHDDHGPDDHDNHDSGIEHDINRYDHLAVHYAASRYIAHHLAAARAGDDGTGLDQFADDLRRAVNAADRWGDDPRARAVRRRTAAIRRAPRNEVTP